ncbi:MAG: hypothetical protein A2161_18645 [Candidatus Schekmanbacteria bacterium RBG_13_48_7]|uniref:N-acetyltransferase domain-containing protein n=1 Tax=Candidatus Schekmanbacteria bacterium RBG_13_48_7 TaxID=1817878 RepID=A0A1F7RLH4_9BACT|nr:MAG: hypothetical protein A2161_18645 [Candidatus Schekmanbacteria bacterium RBG_13_48_7]
MVTIVNVTDPDTPSLFQLLNQFLLTTGEPPLDSQSINRIKKAIRDQKIYFYLAMDSGSAVGICSLTMGYTTYHAGYFGVMEDFYIADAMRKKGVARQMIGKLLQDAKEKGCCSVLLGCSSDDIHMYEHLGFRKIGNMMAIDLPHE